MAQTKLGSFVEAWANIAVGFAVNFTANMLVLPQFGFAVTAADAFGIGLVFTVISLARQYVLRRWFNGLKFGNRAEEEDIPLNRLTPQSYRGAICQTTSVEGTPPKLSGRPPCRKHGSWGSV